MTFIAVLDYGIGNLRSAQKALEHVGADARLTADPGLVREAAGVVLPGRGQLRPLHGGAAGVGARRGRARGDRAQRPFLGICVGMQMLYEGSDESPDDRASACSTPGSGCCPTASSARRCSGTCSTRSAGRRVDPAVQLLDGLDQPTWVYFVHSYAAQLTDDVVATCDYGGPVAAAVERDTLWATQFHPEKSAANGLRLLANFVGAADRAAVTA